MFTHSLAAAHERWLTPSEPETGACRCKACSTNYAYKTFYEFNFGYLCEDCLNESSRPFDSYPELEDEGYICMYCNEPCEKGVVLFRDDVCCIGCAYEGKVLP